jgi:hypothetical protein
MSTSKFKQLVRYGIPDELRRTDDLNISIITLIAIVWSKILKLDDLPGKSMYRGNRCGANNNKLVTESHGIPRLLSNIQIIPNYKMYIIPDPILDFERNYKESVKKLRIDKLNDWKNAKYPTFGGVLNLEKFALTEEGEKVVKNILRIIAHDHPTLEYCPMLPTLIALLLHHLGPDDTLAAIHVLVVRSLDTSNWAYFPTTLGSTMAFYGVFGDLVKIQCPKVFKHLSKLDPEQNGKTFWIQWTNQFLMDLFSLQTAFRLMDCFLVEEYKVLYRQVDFDGN